ncbi:MAG TPA: four helix bundle protein [Gemmatimonadales bacterium]|nr:four helix bundle protein [Gemmatimonadales bacterium]
MSHPPTSAIQSYRDLRVWELAMDLVVMSYRVSKSFPKEERYGLTAQLRRAAVSIPSNIAEGHGRKHLGDYLHQLSVANGSLMELETQIEIARRLNYMHPADQETLMRQAANVGRMLAGLFAALKRRR